MTIERINLLPQESNYSFKLTRETGFAGGVALALVVALVMSVFEYRDLEKKKIAFADTNARLTQVKQQLGTVKSVGEDPGAKKNELVSRYVAQRFNWSELYLELSLLTSPQAWLTSLVTKREDNQIKIELTGEALSQSDVSRFLASLESSYHYRESKLKYSEQLEGFSPPVFRFQLESSLQLKILKGWHGQ